jgi:hypothetical protein
MARTYTAPSNAAIAVKSLYLPHCLSKLLGFGKRVEAVRVARFLNRV